MRPPRKVGSSVMITSPLFDQHFGDEIEPLLAALQDQMLSPVQGTPSVGHSSGDLVAEVRGAGRHRVLQRLAAMLE